MTSPDKKKRKHKKSKRASRTPTRSPSPSSASYDRHQSSYHKHRKGKKEKAHTSPRERSRSHAKQSKKYKRSSPRAESKDRKQPSPQPFPPMWPTGAEAAAGFQMSMFSGMPFGPMFQKIPIQLPTIGSNYKPNKASRTIKNPKTLFKGRLYIPYTYDIAMVTINDKMMSKSINKDIIQTLATRVVQQTEKRARDQKQDEQTVRRITLLQEDVVQSFKLTKKKSTTEKIEKLSAEESILQFSEAGSITEFVTSKHDCLDAEISELINKFAIKQEKPNGMEVEIQSEALVKEARELISKL